MVCASQGISSVRKEPAAGLFFTQSHRLTECKKYPTIYEQGMKSS